MSFLCSLWVVNKEDLVGSAELTVRAHVSLVLVLLSYKFSRRVYACVLGKKKGLRWVSMFGPT